MNNGYAGLLQYKSWTYEQEQQVNLLKLGNYCKVDLTSAIDEVFQKIFRSFPHKTEQEAKELRRKMQIKQEELGVSSSATINKVDKMLVDFDVKARSFQGITFETREQRQKAEADFNSLTSLCGKIDKLSSNECKHLQQEISQAESVTEISEMFMTKISRRIITAEKDEAKKITRYFINNTQQRILD